MLTAYQIEVTNLIQAPSSPTPLVPSAQLTTYINMARRQLAAEAECVRVYATLAVSPSAQQYAFSTINLGGASGVSGVLTVRMMNYVVASGVQRVYPRPWPWFELYELCNPVPVGAPPRIYSQYGQGLNGTFWINLPDTTYTLNLDTACFPIDLVDDTTAEAIPSLWTDAVPFYAAWYTLMQLQKPMDAEAMLRTYEQLVSRARQGVTPTTLPANYEQQADPTLANKLGSQPLRTATDIGAGAAGGRSRPSR